MGDISDLLKNMRKLEVNHEPDDWPVVQMKDISALCDIIKNVVPAIDLLQARMERGEYLAQQDGEWFLFEPSGDSVVCGKTLRDILINLIFTDC